jgi:hypothetical protein
MRTASLLRRCRGIALVAIGLVVVACGGSGATTIGSTKPAGGSPAASIAVGPSGPDATPAPTPAASVATPATTPAGTPKSLALTDLQPLVDGLLGADKSSTPVTSGGSLFVFQQNGSSLRIQVDAARNYDDEVNLEKANVTGGVETGPEDLAGVGDAAVVFKGAGTRTGVVILVAKSGGTMVKLFYSDVSKAADVNKLVPVAQAILAP